MNEEQELKQYRISIDEIDNSLLELINKRASLALKVCEVKLKHHGASAQMFRPEREQQIRERLSQKNSGPLENAAVCRIIQAVMEECKTLEKNHAN